MANTYKKIHLQVVFAVKYRQAVLHSSWRANLFAYMAVALFQRGHFCYIVNGYTDHVHLLFDYKGHELIADLVREVKKSSTNWINEKGWTPNKFAWQGGYGVFSHGYRERDKIIRYIENQEQHHSKQTFRKEYLGMLRNYDIEYRDEYMFKFFGPDRAA